MIKYIQLIKAPSGHQYIIARYSAEGDLIDTIKTTLADIDKKTSRGNCKLRINGARWAMVIDRPSTRVHYIPIHLPKFLK